MNPFGAWVTGMSSTANPELAAKLAMDSYNNAAQLQGQSDVKMQEMLMKQQEEQTKQQALANYLIKANVDPVKANMIGMTIGTAATPPLLANELNLQSTYDPVTGTEVYAPKSQAVGQIAKKENLSADQQKEVDSLPNPKSVDLDIEKADTVLKLLDTGAVGSGAQYEIPGMDFGRRLFANQDEEAQINLVNTSLSDIQSIAVTKRKTQGAVSDYEDKNYRIASGVGPNMSPAANKLGVEAYKLGLQGSKITSRLWAENQGRMGWEAFKSALKRGDFDNDPEMQKYIGLTMDLQNRYNAIGKSSERKDAQPTATIATPSPTSSASKPTVTNTKPTLSQSNSRVDAFRAKAKAAGKSDEEINQFLKTKEF